MQLYNIFQIIAQEIIKLKGDLTEAFNAQENKINNKKKIKINKLIKYAIFGMKKILKILMV